MMECRRCQKERYARERVIRQTTNEELQKPKYGDSTLIVANNDVKYDTNKRRARYWAKLQKQGIAWTPAQDIVTVEALQIDPALVEKKKEWLKRHDRESGNLHGMLLLIRGMPVGLTEHIDRNPKRNSRVGPNSPNHGKP